MTKKDYYETLEVTKSSSLDEIKRSYKKLAKKYHPDLNKSPDAEQKFKEISEAYAVLSDPNKRQQYDQFGHTGFDQRYSQEDIFRGFDFNVFEEIFGGRGGGFSDIFDMFFGGQRKQRQQRGNDLRYDLEISLKDAYQGIKKTISFNKLVKCATCQGSGSKDGKTRTCSKCNGSGSSTVTHRTPFGTIAQSSICNNCHGQGSIIETPCPTCSAAGVFQDKVKVEVSIPAGVDTGSRLRLSNEGDSSKSGLSGDLYVVIHVTPSEEFERRGDDLYKLIPISFSQAALGDKIKVKTLDSNIELKIPSGTQSGTLFRLKKKGMPSLEGYSQGDLFIQVIVKTPEKLNKKQKELFEKLAKESKEELKLDKSFFEKIFNA